MAVARELGGITGIKKYVEWAGGVVKLLYGEPSDPITVMVKEVRPALSYAKVPPIAVIIGTSNVSSERGAIGEYFIQRNTVIGRPAKENLVAFTFRRERDRTRASSKRISH